MTWQDVALVVSFFALGVALIPSVIEQAKPARATCLLTAVAITVITVCFATLKLWLSTLAEGIAAALWFVLLLQRRRK